MKWTIYHIDKLSSTNLFLKELTTKTEVEEGTVITTNFQTNGRGQKSNLWESDPGQNLLFSFIVYPDFIPVNDQFILSQACSLAIKNTLDRYTNNIFIKWPNDIYWNEKKIGGILIENILSNDTLNQSIFGIGINLNQTCFYSNAPNPVSLKQITGIHYNREKIMSEILEKFSCLYSKIINDKNRIIRQYKTVLYRRNGVHPFYDKNGIFYARIKDISTEGQLMLLTENGQEKKYWFKEVRFI